MSSAMMLERGGLGTASFPTANVTSQGLTASLPATNNWCVLPRCEIRMEKCKDGVKIFCSAEDEVACGGLQNLCKMLAGGMCSCCCTLNGITICQCNLACGICKCEYTKDGVCITCTSGDEACCAMLQACCDCLSCCQESGCCCYISFNNTPVCCSVC